MQPYAWLKSGVPFPQKKGIKDMGVGELASYTSHREKAEKEKNQIVHGFQVEEQKGCCGWKKKSGEWVTDNRQVSGPGK